jgi:hypothetical protein
MKRTANKSVETNRRPASPSEAGRKFGSALCAPAVLSAAVAHLGRYPMRITLLALSMLGVLCVAPGCTTAVRPACSVASSQPKTVTDVLNDPQFKQVAQALENSEK